MFAAYGTKFNFGLRDWLKALPKQTSFQIYYSQSKNLIKMKIKLTKEQIEKILADPEKAQEAGIQTNDPWWVIVLKVLAYLIGLLLAGAATTSCAAAAGIQMF